jgi:hypothetical protein
MYGQDEVYCFDCRPPAPTRPAPSAGSAPSYDGVQRYRGTCERRGGAHLSPGVSERVAHALRGDPAAHGDFAVWMRDARFQAATFIAEGVPMLTAVVPRAAAAPALPAAAVNDHEPVEVKEQRQAKEEKVLTGKNKGASKGTPSGAAGDP